MNVTGFDASVGLKWFVPEVHPVEEIGRLIVGHEQHGQHRVAYVKEVLKHLAINNHKLR